MQLLKINQEVQERENYLEFLEDESLEPGTYWLYVKIEWHKHCFDDFKDEMILNINSYGAAPVSFSLEQHYNKAMFLDAMFRSKAIKIPREEFKQPSGIEEPIYVYKSEVENGYQYIYIDN